jgi:hypothetical protein
MDHPSLRSRVVGDAHCSHLRHKGMYVMTTPDPGEAACHDPFDASAYWCTRTQKALGPDGRPARPDDCGDARSCCEH